MTTLDLDALERAAELIRKALIWADWCAGEGLISADENIPEPEDFLFEYSVATGEEDWERFAEKIAGQYSALIASHRALQERVEGAEKALEFYRDGFQFHPKRGPTGIDHSEWKPRPELLDDCGNVAVDYFAARTKAGEPHEQE